MASVGIRAEILRLGVVSSVLMAGGRGDHGGRRWQVPMEEAPHRDRSIEDAMLIEDL